MSELTGARSVPRVFIGGKFYGGGDEMMNMHRNKPNNLKRQNLISKLIFPQGYEF